MEDLRKLRESRLDGLEEIILYYEEQLQNGNELSDEQRKQLEDASFTVQFFGEYGQYLHEIAEVLLAA